MSRKAADAGDDKRHKVKSGDSQSAEDASGVTCAKEDTDSDNEDSSEENEEDDEESKTEEPECKTWLQVLPSKGGLLLAVLLTEIMTEGMTPEQMNILGNFISSVGSLISYKASRDDLDIP